MTGPDTLFFAVLIALNILLGAGLAALAVWNVRLRRESRQVEQRLFRDFQDLCSGGIRMGQRVDSMENRVKALVEKIGQMELSDSRFGPYHQAVRLADRGARVDELMSECGVTLGEAELIANLHRLGSSSRVDG